MGLEFYESNVPGWRQKRRNRKMPMIALYGRRKYRSPPIPGKTEGLALFGEHENDDVNTRTEVMSQINNRVLVPFSQRYPN